MELQQAQANVAAASHRAGAYLSSWGAWAAEKRKAGWTRSVSAADGTAGSHGVEAGDDRPKVTTVSELGKHSEKP